MKCNLIFYIANKTNYCQIALSKCLENAGLEIDNVRGTTTPDALGEALSEFLSENNICFIVGGLEQSGKKGIKTLLSSALYQKNIPLENVCKLRNESTLKEGFAIKCGNQLIVSLPDSPQDIHLLFDENLIKYLNKFI